jgi:hypothetical protein
LYVAGSGAALSLVLFFLSFSFTDTPVHAERLGPHTISIQATTAQGHFDFIDLPNIYSDLVSKYDCCENQLFADGQRLRRLGDFHLFPGDGISG